jgi:Putative Ig domain
VAVAGNLDLVWLGLFGDGNRRHLPGPGWQVYGGTSASSPIIASVYALAGTPGASDSPNAYPYTHTSSLFDVTSGNNGTCSPAVLCTAGAGWDGPTGPGTPNGTAAFSGVSTGVNTISITNPGTQTSTAGSLQSLQIHASDTGPGSWLSYSATGLPPGLVINSGTGLFSGTPTTGGTYTVTVTATDGTSASGSTTFTWVIRALGVPGAPGALVTVSPARVLDTRTGNGGAQAPVAAGADLVLQVAGRGGVPTTGVSAVVVNVTVTAPTAPGWVSAFADGAALPLVSNLNFVASQTVPNLAIVPVGADGKIRLHNGSVGNLQLVADVSGYFLP